MNEAPTEIGIRWRTPVLIVLMAVAAVALLHFTDWLESYVAFWLSMVISTLAVALLVFWFAFRSGLPGGTRLRGLGLLLVLGVASAVVLRFTTRIEGTLNGVGVPRLVWKWSPRPGDRLTSLPTISSDSRPVDLTATTPLDSPEFLGPGRRNVVVGAGLSRDWNHPPRQLWRQPIGLGWSSFAIVGPWAITQEERGDTELVVCYELATGKTRWEHAHEHARFSEWQGGDGPRATPTISGGRVYAMGATGILDCLDGSTGRVVWSRDLVAETHGHNQTYGKSCSPLVIDDRVIVTGPHGGPSLLAYRAADGTPVWSGGGETPGYASPVLATIAGVRQVLTINGVSAASHDLIDGHLLWRFDWPGQMPKNTQPVALDGDRVLISAGYGLGTTVLQIRLSGSTWSAEPLWTSRHLKSKFSQLAIHGNAIYGLDDGTLTCLDLAAGKRLWRGEHYGFGQLLRVDDLLIVQTEPGDVALVEASPGSFRELGRFPALGDKTWTQPALSGHHLLVRNDREAACYELP